MPPAISVRTATRSITIPNEFAYDVNARSSACCPDEDAGESPVAAYVVTVSSHVPTCCGVAPAASSLRVTPPTVSLSMRTVPSARPAA